ncbi:MAG: anaerobic ribonucleoside-triphosphate reductase activating protein [Paludibacteraceae bacterium]|nr:anaerobic ribonucleoside-triphosphate reductase activating protein [Paludibacteraceae bacterium]
MKIASYDIVFQEVPGEVTLALNISGCPNRCPGCHSPHLREDIGEELTDELLDTLINQYRTGITCVCFMGGDQDPDEVARLAAHVKVQGIKTGWYSGTNSTTREPLPASPQGEVNRWAEFDFVKVGPYVEALGGLKSPTTNQRFYRREGNIWHDETYRFQRKPSPPAP